MVFRLVLIYSLCLAASSFAALPSEVPDSGYAKNLPLLEKDFEGASSFSSDDRIVGTYYFYWYDYESSAHMTSPSGKDGLRDHPPSFDDFSYKSVSWHQRQIEDMMEAGIDFAAAVTWGCPSCECQKWSFEGVPPMIQACDEIVQAGGTPPKIAMFYDTHSLHGHDYKEKIDLTTEFGREWFYQTVRDFYAMIPTKYWAMIDDKPIVFLYLSKYAANYDQACFDYLGQRFQEDFAGHTPYVIRELSWDVQTDNIYAWGGAPLGFRALGITALGPGYDHSPAVPPRQPRVVDRRGGEFYEENWQAALKLPNNIVVIETWNELHEGTDICETREYGRQYIELTAKYTTLFHEGKQVKTPPGPYANAESVSVTFGEGGKERGLKRLDHADGMVSVTEVDGVGCIKTIPHNSKPGHIYLAIDNDFLFGEAADVEAEIEFLDNASTQLSIDYNSTDFSQIRGGAYTPSEPIQMTGTGTWRTAKVTLRNAWFLGCQNARADLRVVHTGPELFVRRVTVRK